VKLELIKILEESTDSSHFDLSCSTFLLVICLEARETKAKIRYWDFVKRSFCTTKETINKNKRPPTEWEKIFANDLSDKGLV